MPERSRWLGPAFGSLRGDPKSESKWLHGPAETLKACRTGRPPSSTGKARPLTQSPECSDALSISKTAWAAIV